jgi:hypothetical protein
MEITRKDPFTGKINTHNLNITKEEMVAWEKANIYIQDAFPRLTADEREFVKTGINIGSFDALFPDEDEDYEDDEDDEDAEDVSDDGYLAVYNEDEDEDNTDAIRFEEMMRLAKNTRCRVMQCMIAMTKTNHDYDLALEWLIVNGQYIPRTDVPNND